MSRRNAMSKKKERAGSGFVKPGFEAVRETFAENFTRRNELGAACCIYYQGEKAVDPWGGIRNRAGLKATTLLPFKVPQQMMAFYHQKWDGPEVLTIEPLLNVLKLSVEWVRNGGE
jgi:hypothetical protein